MGERKLIQGVGNNDARYAVYPTVNGKRVYCNFYKTWKCMIERSYSEKFKQENPSYADCTVHEEWLTFSKFKSWMEVQDWEGKFLDKDLLIQGNKLYSPQTCIFVSAQVNNFILDCYTNRGEYPTGVSLDRGKYKACCRKLGKGQKTLGYYDTPEQAHKIYWAYKCKLAKELAALQDDRVVADRLLELYKE